MYQALQILSVVLAAIATGLSLALVLERPGKMRLGREAYLMVQTIYAPGFVIGWLAEPLLIVATLILVAATESDRPAFWPTLIAFVFFVLAHAAYWAVVQPVRKFWQGEQPPAATKYLAIVAGQTPKEEWILMRDRWEAGHRIRATLYAIGLLCLAGGISA